MMLNMTKQFLFTNSRRALSWQIVAGIIVLMVVLSRPAQLYADDDDDSATQVTVTLEYNYGGLGYASVQGVDVKLGDPASKVTESQYWTGWIDDPSNSYNDPVQMPPLPAEPTGPEFYTWLHYSLSISKLKKGEIFSIFLPWYATLYEWGFGSSFSGPDPNIQLHVSSSCACVDPQFADISTDYGLGQYTFGLFVDDPNIYRIYDNDTKLIFRYLGSKDDINQPNPDPAGNGTGFNGSAHLTFSLGNNANGTTAGDIQLNQNLFTAGSYSPASLQAGGYDGVTILNTYDSNDNACLRQALSDDVLADVITDSDMQYHISFYPASQVSGTDPNTGLYLTGGQAPFVTYTVANPDTTGSTTTQLQLTESRPGQADKVSLFTIDPVSGSSTLVSGNGTWQDSRLHGTDPSTGDPTIDHTVQALVGTNWVVASRVLKTYHQFPWGQELTKKVVDPAGAALTTTYSYYTSTDPSQAYHYGQRQSVTNPDGSWEADDWLYSTQVQTLTPWKDSPGVTAATATSANCHATIINGAETDELINGTLVSKTVGNSSTNTVEGQAVTIDAETSYASASDTTGLTTTTYTYASYLTGPSASKLYGVDNPDGTGERHYYTQGDFDPVALAFTPDVNGTAVSEEIVHNGGPAQGTCDVHVTNGAGQLVLEETYLGGYSVNPAANPANRISQTAHAFDANGNPTLDTLNGRVTHQQSWANGQRQSEIDESGIETDYTYDLRNRLASSTKKGVPAYGAYAAQADIVTTYSYDAADRQTGTVTTAGSLVQVSSMAYDVAGRIIGQTQNGLTTSISYANGGLATTTTLPNGATQVTSKYVDGQTKSTTGSGVVASFYDYQVTAGGLRQAITYAGSANSPRTQTTTTDGLGRTVEQDKPAFGGGTFTTTNVYNGLGQLAKTTQTGLADTLYVYDANGNLNFTGLDMDGDGSLGPGSTDRITGTYGYYQPDSGHFDHVANTTVYGDLSSYTSTQVEQVSGLPTNVVSKVSTTDLGGNATMVTTTVDLAHKLVTTTTLAPNATNPAVQVAYNGLLVSTSTPVSPTPALYTYDALGRLSTASDPSTGAVTTTTYDAVYGQTASLTTTGGGVTTATLNTYYGPAEVSPGQLKSTTVNGMTTNYTYTPLNQVSGVSGNTYPLAYSYDTYGALQTLTTNGAAGAATTTWVYDAATGLLQQKLDASGHGASYTYYPFGAVKTRTWARGTVTSYGYDAGGILSSQSYNDGVTPSVAITNGRQGWPISVTDAAGTHALTYTPDGQLASDTISGSGALAGTAVSVGYDSLLRRNALSASNGSGLSYSVGYGYDPVTGNLTGVTDNTNNTFVRYTYQPNSTRLATTTFNQGEALRLTTTRTSDGLGRLASITNTASGSAGVVSSHAYTYNAQGQRSTATLADGSVWSYGYNANGELTSGHHAWSAGGTAVAGQQFDYAYDGIGNRTSTTTNGRSATYTANTLNQYSARQVPGAVDVLGTADPAATVTVNTQPVDSRQQGGYFYKGLSVNNTGGPINQAVDVLAVKTGAGAGGTDVISETQGSVFVPQTPESFSYDLDGNLTQDGRWTYNWDGENRLVQMRATITDPTVGQCALAFTYDRQGRRVSKVVTALHPPSRIAQAISSSLFLYDGWNLMAELGVGNVPLRSYVWGTDLSGSLQGAGGVGGLVTVADFSGTSSTPNYYVCNDGNGNIVSLINSADGSVSAQYQHGPFGEPVETVGIQVLQKFPLRFSSKYCDSESGLSYFGDRYYNHYTGTWLDKDPIEEHGGLNLYDYSQNAPIDHFDAHGDCCYCECAESLKLADPAFVEGHIGSPPIGNIEIRFNLDLVASYNRITTKDKMPATLEWWEQTANVDPPVTGPSNQWHNGVPYFDPNDKLHNPFYKWENRQYIKYSSDNFSGNSFPLHLEDFTVTAYSQLPQYINFDIVLISSPGCKCKHPKLEVTAFMSIDRLPDNSIKIRTTPESHIGN